MHESPPSPVSTKSMCHHRAVDLLPGWEHSGGVGHGQHCPGAQELAQPCCWSDASRVGMPYSERVRRSMSMCFSAEVKRSSICAMASNEHCAITVSCHQEIVYSRRGLPRIGNAVRPGKAGQRALEVAMLS